MGCVDKNRISTPCASLKSSSILAATSPGAGVPCAGGSSLPCSCATEHRMGFPKVPHLGPSVRSEITGLQDWGYRQLNATWRWSDVLQGACSSLRRRFSSMGFSCSSARKASCWPATWHGNLPPTAWPIFGEKKDGKNNGKMMQNDEHWLKYDVTWLHEHFSDMLNPKS